MLTIRLSRTGKKKQPQYRIVLQENHRDPWSPAKEILGHYNPRAKKNNIVLDEERIKHWLSIGAQPSATVHNMLVNAGIIKANKKRVVTISKKRAAKMEEKKVEKQEKDREAKESAKIAKEAEILKTKEEKETAETAKAEKQEDFGKVLKDSQKPSEKDSVNLGQPNVVSQAYSPQLDRAKASNSSLTVDPIVQKVIESEDVVNQRVDEIKKMIAEGGEKAYLNSIDSEKVAEKLLSSGILDSVI